MSKITMIIEYTPETNKIAVNGPLDNFSVCDVMLEGAKRVVMKRWLELQKTRENKIQVAQPSMLPPNGGRM